jgi:hypothetical protein
VDVQKFDFIKIESNNQQNDQEAEHHVSQIDATDFHWLRLSSHYEYNLQRCLDQI